MTEERGVAEAQVRQVRLGSGANCSSIGSVVDTLFASAAAGAAIFAAIVAALGAEPVRVVGPPCDAKNDAGRDDPEHDGTAPSPEKAP